jgi:hypothetical protein
VLLIGANGQANDKNIGSGNSFPVIPLIIPCSLQAIIASNSHGMCVALG